MMNIPETAGEPSCKRQENGDAATGSERPLKKARFAWQVKGNRKYHMKNDSTDGKALGTSTADPDKPSSSHNESDTQNLVGSTEQNLEILGDYLLKQDFNTIDSVITDTDKSLLKPSTSLTTEKVEYPRYSTFDSNKTSNTREEYSPMTPISLVACQSYSEDQCIARWQARQMAKGFVDNTINRVLDSWMVAPLPADIDNRFLALDVAEFINNLPGANSIENEGILMAISAHGLQNPSSSSSSNEGSKEDSSSTKIETFPSPSNSPIQSEDENENKMESNTDLNDLQMAWSYDERDSNTRTDFSLYPDVSSSSYLSYVDNDQLPTTNTEYDTENTSDDFTSHFDFMDAAVSFAIQNKGLTSFGTDYG